MFTIIVYSVNPRRVVHHALRAAARMAAPDVELIFMDGSAEGVASVPSVFRHEHRPGTDYQDLLFEAVQGATGSWVAIIEDHVVVAPGWMQPIRAHAASGKTSVLYGKSHAAPRRSRGEWVHWAYRETLFRSPASKRRQCGWPIVTNLWAPRTLYEGIQSGASFVVQADRILDQTPTQYEAQQVTVHAKPCDVQRIIDETRAASQHHIGNDPRRVHFAWRLVVTIAGWGRSGQRAWAAWRHIRRARRQGHPAPKRVGWDIIAIGWHTQLARTRGCWFGPEDAGARIR